ncbi:MAG: histidine kinase [Cellulophaga sp.]|uniref:sensor histidine kinase n=1 Tax=unclassified Cellulophaga TaxID=2634405 RepID=UPI000C2BCFB8|nr:MULTISPECIES: histidine kinase [unclassified Cellulophaga]MDO6492355.1 histidine kinase [Cellulophaga sp. 2_MG-2023]MDO6496145.1 histidine kinase [Cellulophaga sp. 3_MG-2023]PKB44987.1 histidine kinase [Cellulophaga sp. RHA19]
MNINTDVDSFLNKNSSKSFEINYKHHIIFWVIYFIFNSLRYSNIHQDFMLSLRMNLIGFPIHMAIAYFNVYYLMPKFVFKKKYISYTFSVIATLFIMLLVKYSLTYYFIGPNVWPEGPEELKGLTLNYATTMMVGELYVSSFVAAIKLTIDWLKEHSKLHELEKRQLSTELRFLRSQVSPHFFFNTLNNVYSLTLEKSDKAPEVILKLSELMRYLLYATKKNKQDLKSELDCIQNYLDLERLRFDESLNINISISGDLEGKRISPMLLIPVIENCFKHGASKNIGDMIIDIDVKVSEDLLHFKVSNTIPVQSADSLIPIRSGGIGLSNLKKRLELGYKKEDYHLSIFEKDNMFNVILKLKV